MIAHHSTTGAAGGKKFLQHSVDVLPIEGTSVELIDLDKVVTHVAQAQERGRYHGPTDPMHYLVESGCVADLDGERCATPAGVLAFGRNPQRIFPYAVVDVGHYRGTEMLSFEVLHLEKGIGGTIIDQLRRVQEYIWRATNHGMTLSHTGALERVELHEYPQFVVRELLVNMLAHRDYGIVGSPARVALFKNRIEWISPGGLPPGVTVDNMMGLHVARNPRLLTILYEAGLVEAFGQGLATVANILKQEQMQPAVFRDVMAAFIVTVFGRNMEDAFESGQGTSMSATQRKIVLQIQSTGPLSPRDLRERIPDRSERSLQRDIKSLLAAGVIEPEGEARAVRYRLRIREQPVESTDQQR